MTVTTTSKDPEALSMSFSATFHVRPEQVWHLWADPRLLERWWGPPGYPATVVAHDLAVGGVVDYYMTGPDGQRYPGGFRVTEVEEPTRLTFEDYFADADGSPDAAMPVSTTRVEITPGADGTTVMTITSTAPSREAWDQLVEMGAVEGMEMALGQIDLLLAENVCAQSPLRSSELVNGVLDVAGQHVRIGDEFSVARDTDVHRAVVAEDAQP
jgi:uncharacterized protein YndB with AHSA1/START domain